MVDKITVDDYGLSRLDDEGLALIEKVISESEIELHDAILLCDEDSTRAPIEDNSVRSGKTAFLPVNEDLVQLFGNLIQDYNQNHSGWGYELEFIESIQLGHYHEGDFYDWHTDSFKNPSIQTEHQYHPERPYNRKVSVTVWLNEPDEYEGGEFDLETRGPNAEERFDTFKMPKGTMIVFPSHLWHRVRPVTLSLIHISEPTRPY